MRSDSSILLIRTLKNGLNAWLFLSQQDRWLEIYMFFSEYVYTLVQPGRSGNRLCGYRLEIFDMLKRLFSSPMQFIINDLYDE